MKILLLLLPILTLAIKGDQNEGDLEELFEMKIDQGALRGFKEKSLKGREFFSFKGIPFAQPPEGNLRFKDPKPAEAWDGTLDATKDQEICMQPDLGGFMTKNITVMGSEDCLYLNVFTPKPNKNEKLPVMVFIHGGGFVLGSAAEYGPHVLLEEDVVLVVIQYRLGPFGFLSTGDSIMSGNYGLKDQVMALKWVKMNIQQFGGDAGRVTIFGESAGAASVHHLMLSPWAKGLFHGVISQSGTAICPWGFTRKARQIAEKFGEGINCPLGKDSKAYRCCLLEKEAGEILKNSEYLMQWSSSPIAFLPNIDRDFLTMEPLHLLKNGDYNKVNYISGINKDEGVINALITSLPVEMQDDLFNNFDRFGPLTVMVHDEENPSGLTDKIFRHYLQGQKLNKETYLTLKDMFTDRLFSVCNDLATHFHAQDPDIKTYRYQLDWDGQMSLLTFMGAPSGYEENVAHGDELFYLFSGGQIFSLPMVNQDDLKMREIFVKLWTNFAATGDPTPDDSLGFRWNASTLDEFHHLRLTLPAPNMSDYVNTKSQDFWRSLPLTENSILQDMEAFCRIKKGEL